jgi:hypothetical protein
MPPINVHEVCIKIHTIVFGFDSLIVDSWLPKKLCDRLKTSKIHWPFMGRMLVVAIGVEGVVIPFEEWPLNIDAYINEKVRPCVKKNSWATNTNANFQS